jgi:hypothetical protein
MLYFKALPGTPARTLFDKYYVLREANRKATTAFLDKYATTGKYLSINDVISGIFPKPEFSDQFKKASKGTFMPRAKSQAAKDLASIPKPVRMMDWSSKHLGHGLLMGEHQRGLGFAICFAKWAYNPGNDPVLYCNAQVKKAATKWPEGLEEITETQALALTKTNEPEDTEEGGVF